MMTFFNLVGKLTEHLACKISIYIGPDKAIFRPERLFWYKQMLDTI